MDAVGIEQARLTLGDIVDRARIAGQATAITRHGKPAAVVVSAEWYEGCMKYIAGGIDFDRYEVIHLDGDPVNNDPANLELREKPS